MNQIGTDRIIELEFSDGQYRLYMEFYAGGNIVLTDKELTVLALFRIVPEGPSQEDLRVGLKYSLENRQNYAGVPSLTSERVRAGLQKTLDNGSGPKVVQSVTAKKKRGGALRKALAGSLSEFPPILLDHSLHVANFDAATPIELVLNNEGVLQRLLLALEEAKTIYDGINRSGTRKGYIIAKLQDGSRQDKQEQEPEGVRRAGMMYEDFQPFLPRQWTEEGPHEVLEFNGFNTAVDEFFSSIESQKLESRLTEREKHARKKLETAKQDHEQRLEGLRQTQELNVRKAQAIEGNLQRVQEAIGAVNSLIAQSIGWAEIDRLIEMEQQRNNAVAEMIVLPLKLSENTITLLLAEADYQGEADFEGEDTESDVSDSEDEGAKASISRQLGDTLPKPITVDVDLASSPWSNARQYYDQKKTAAVKEQRTLQSSERALKNTERKINADLKKGLKQEKDVLRPHRKAMWFEKFVYFISSEGYLVIGGKDAQQADIIYKKHLKKGDAYVHADLQGAASVIVKNKVHRADDPLPPSTLSQAGTLAVCTSSAWDSKAIMSAWWVHADQVSKTGHGGEYLQPGSFTITGQKNFLAPAQLLLGFGIIFRVSEESKARHQKHRIQDNDNANPQETAHLDEMLADSGETGAVQHDDGEIREGEEEDQSKSSDEDFEDENEHTEEPVNTFEDAGHSEGEDEDGHAHYNPLQPTVRQQTVLGESPLPTADTDSESSDNDGTGKTVSISRTEGDNGRGKDDRESSDNGESDSGKGVRHLSAKQRRLMRKGVHPDSSENIAKTSTTVNPSQDSHALTQVGGGRLNPTQVRGKKGKRNKIKTKYADQDEEDRNLAMGLLGSSTAQARLEEDQTTKASKEAELAAVKDRQRKQHALAAEKGKGAEKQRLLDFEKAAGTFDEDEPEHGEDIEAFVGVPLAGDEILDALVVCGPWDAIGSRCRWRAKLQPGSLKKGKAVKEILGAWIAALGAWENKKHYASEEENAQMTEEHKMRRREAELIRAVREPEVIGVIPVGKVRVTMGAIDGSKGKRGGTTSRGRRGGKGSKRR